MIIPVDEQIVTKISKAGMRMLLLFVTMHASPDVERVPIDLRILAARSALTQIECEQSFFGFCQVDGDEDE